MKGIAKDDFIKNMDWNWKTKMGKNSHSDVSVNVDSGGRVRMTFRNNVNELFESSYLVFAFCKNRIVFMAANQNDGYKITTSGENQNKYLYAKVDDFDKRFVGDYDLKYDDFLELYYIEIK